MMCPTCGGAMLTERPHRHSATDRTPSTAAGRAMYAKWGHHNFVDEWNATILAIEDEARAPLDVERLYDALAHWYDGADGGESFRLVPMSSDGGVMPTGDLHPFAAAIAREYAALEEPTPGPQYT